MKTAIPLGLLLLVGATAALHRASPPPAASLERQVAIASPGTAPEGPSVVMPAPSSMSPADVAPEAKRPAAPAPDRKGVAAASARMTALLDRELTLAAHQRDAVEQLLKDRDAEIKACHAAILRSGVIDIPQYEWQVIGMKDGWYRKIDVFLDRAQHERFLALVQRGLFNEGLAFTVEPGMTVLD